VRAAAAPSTAGGVEAAAISFNEHINAADLDGLAGLMTEDHTFIDTSGSAVHGRTDCVQAWRGFLDAFPGYRNTFELVRAYGDTAAIRGRSDCPGRPDLTGSALWTARVRGGLVAEWRVHDDVPDARRRLGLD
jgi:ketosteroid isomerase-like protein